MDGLKDKVAVVTGGARGIGRGIASVLMREGAFVAIADIEPSGESPHDDWSMSLRMDVANSRDVDHGIGQVVNRFGRIDILINNAGIAQPKEILEITEQDWDRVIDVNLKGSFLCCKAVLPHMIQRHFGRIVNISSISARRGAVYGHVHYSASKAGQLGLTRSLARWCGDKGITVNAIAPGSVQTQALSDSATAEQIASVVRDTPLKRLGTPGEVGELAAWLCSDAAAFVTGAVFDINGGAWMG